MRRQLAVALLATFVIWSTACSADYDPPKSYGVGPQYGNLGHAYGSSTAPLQFSLMDVGFDIPVTDVSGGGDTEEVKVVDLEGVDLPEAYYTCLDEFQAYADYCTCLHVTDEYANDPNGAGCECKYRVCVESPDPNSTFPGPACAQVYPELFDACTL